MAERCLSIKVQMWVQVEISRKSEQNHRGSKLGQGMARRGLLRVIWATGCISLKKCGRCSSCKLRLCNHSGLWRPGNLFPS